MDDHTPFPKLESTELYKRLSAETTQGTWKKARELEAELASSWFTRACGDQMFQVKIFINDNNTAAKGACIFGPWTKGGLGFVHGGAMTAMHDHICGCLVGFARHWGARGSLVDVHSDSTVVTAKMETNFRRGLPLGEVVSLSAAIEEVEGRKVRASSRLTSEDGSVLYSDATSLWVVVKKSKL